jgi:Ala-tRNA(Pro) deacylase
MLATPIQQYLDENRAKYTTIRHPPTITAQETAAAADIPGHKLAKTVMVKIDGDLAMVVLPANRRIDLERVKRAARAQTVRIADEVEFAKLFPGCELGAMPPLGQLYGFDVICAFELTEDDEIAFNGGYHDELIQLPYAEFRRLVRPKVADVCARR